MNRNLCKKVLEEGGKLIPLLIPPKDSRGLGLMNPSILIDKTRILLNLRNINYTLYHCEGEQIYNNRWGPLVYLNPENDIHLRTFNFMCELDPETLEIKEHYLTDTKTYDVEPIWEFVGLEDARLVRWEGKLFQCGVRRDTTPNGQGRMELSEIAIRNDNPEYWGEEVKEGESKFKEIARSRIEPPNDKNSYCEKNWMPVLDMPYHFVKWTNPTEVVKVNTVTKTSQTVFLANSHIPNLPDFRGGSQVIPYKDYRICLVHEVNLFKNKIDQKDATYTHRFIVWDKNWNIIKMSESFSFMDGEIEFTCGLAIYKKNMLITFGFQDNAAFILQIPEKIIDELLGFKRKKEFNWGIIEKDKWFKTVLEEEIFKKNSYQKYFEVKENDVVVDVGASVGPFSYSIIDKKPKKIYCIEPDKRLFSTLKENLNYSNIVFINKGIYKKDGNAYLSGLYNENSNLMYKESEKEVEVITFKTFIKNNNIEKIDFLKLDCEGGEYDIFNDENFEWIRKNVKKIVGEWHLSDEKLRDKFIHFRDSYLKFFKNYEVIAMNDIDIKWDLFNEHFTQYYGQVMIYINNQKVEENELILPIKNFGVPIKKEEKEIKKEIKEPKWKATSWPTLEITTSIPAKGCLVNCVFCPQKTLVKSYNGERVLTLDNFKKALEKIPEEIVIIFSGFTEPWMNSSTTDMLLYAHAKGHRIAVFTTGVGMSIEDVERIKDIPYSLGPDNPILSAEGYPMLNGGFILHLPDQENYSKHVMNKKYMEVLEYFKRIEDEIRGFRTVSLGPVHEKVKDMWPNTKILRLWARANNLVKEEELKPELVKLNDKYNKYLKGPANATCGCDEKLYHNVLLPNGDLVLCCMDYSLDYVLGNIFTQEYNDILPELNTPFKMCTYCENGIPVIVV